MWKRILGSIVLCCALVFGASVPTAFAQASEPEFETAVETEIEAWQPKDGTRLVFDVLRDGKSFGLHTVSFERRKNRLKVDTDIELEVKIGPIRAFHYVHDTTEEWVGDRLVRVAARTKSGGKWSEMAAMTAEGGLQVSGVEFKGLVPATSIPSTHWKVAEMAQSRMLSTETGALLPMEVTDKGIETVETGSGPIEARKFTVKSDLTASFWYDARGRWVKCEFEARGSTVSYVLRKLPA